MRQQTRQWHNLAINDFQQKVGIYASKHMVFHERAVVQLEVKRAGTVELTTKSQQVEQPFARKWQCLSRTSNT
jgi:hypothetical protein